MEVLYRESRPILPRQLQYLTILVAIATLVFMAISKYVLDTDMPDWAIPAVAVVVVLAIIACTILKFDLEVTDESVTIRHAFRKIEVPISQIIDSRMGETALIRNYGGYNLKGVKHSFYSAIGEDDGVAMKITGKRVIVVSCMDPEAVFRLLPKDDKE